MLAPQWQAVELRLTGPRLDQPYVDADPWVDFTHSSGEVVSRPAFSDGGEQWGVRFASVHAEGTWTWRVRGEGWEPVTGTLTAAPAHADARHPALRHGFTRLAAGGRGLVHADGSPALVVADTAWAMPWRATVEDVGHYARDRQRKGFNAVLLMTVQPDMGARGPRGRNLDEGFEVGFEDLPQGRLTRLVVDYFRYLDDIVAVLVDHGITPVLQPVFHGFGWKGLQVAGPVVPPEDYVRYCRYLLARYGADPAIYLVGADGDGTEPQIAAGGAYLHEADAYGQPTGIHYRPHARNDAHQDAAWLDFQWCQTGHQGDHVPDRVATMWRQQPVRAVMNGEPTYERSGRSGKAEGWWQGHEAWSNLCAGAVMGVAYGAGSLWQWVVRPDEPGHEPFFLAPGAGWRGALELEGSRYVGLLGQILAGLPVHGAEPCWDVSLCTRGLLGTGELYIGYAEHGGRWVFLDADGRVPSSYWLLDPRTGELLASGERPPGRAVVEDPSSEEVPAPRVMICADRPPPFLEHTGQVRPPAAGQDGAR
ncbi:apiosidase-like domain-containing protein [Auraticoccus monumenti]|uniref:DUF4038 domain-containing protein n=1 Tax=Auraticoccus monumenti TaxID=675864 RepID=A0A1G6YWV8_9ACTN|nr:DUF4038 domain-containing protein [Auraticoccus monumenti]SDD94820.1 protein of unknown function [Auraticoccus monumenti]